jgi:hypothetical protein
MKWRAGGRPPYEEVDIKKTSIWGGGKEGDLHMKWWAGGRPPHERVGRRESST